MVHYLSEAGSGLTMMNFRQMAADIAGRITGGEWPAGAKVPTSRDFAAEYGVHVNTADKALTLLVDRGLLIGRPPHGRFVAAKWGH